MKCKLKLITERGTRQFSEMINLQLSKHPQLIGGTFWAPVVQKVDSAIQWINHYPVDSAILVFLILSYPLDSDLSGGLHYPTFEKLGPHHFRIWSC